MSGMDCSVWCDVPLDKAEEGIHACDTTKGCFDEVTTTDGAAQLAFDGIEHTRATAQLRPGHHHWHTVMDIFDDTFALKLSLIFGFRRGE